MNKTTLNPWTVSNVFPAEVEVQVDVEVAKSIQGRGCTRTQPTHS